MNEMSKHFLGAPFREVCCCHSHLEKSLFAPVTNVTVWGVVVAAFPGCGVKGCRPGWRAEPQIAQPPPETTLLRPIRP